MVRPRSSFVLGCVLALVPAAFGQDDASYRAATGLLHRGMPEQAAVEYRAFLREQPTHEKADSARYALSVCLVRLSKWEEAAGELDALAGRKFEFAPDVLLLRAQCHLNAQERDGAIRCLTTLLRDHPDFTQTDGAAAMLGESLAREGDAEAARAVLKRFEREWPRSVSRARAEFVLATLDAAEGNDQEAADRLARLREAFPGSEVEGQALLSEAQCRHRLAASDPREAERAAALYRSIVNAKWKELAPQAMLGLAQLSRAAGDVTAAGRTLDELLSRYAGDAAAGAARVERARVFLDEGKAEEALVALEPLLGKQDAPAEASYWAGKAEIRLDRFAAAAKRLEQAARTNAQSPLLPEILFDRAVALARDDKGAQAAAVYREVRARFLEHPLAPEALAAQASLALRAGDGAASVELSRQFLDSHPKHARAASVQLVLAEALSLSGKDEEAAGIYETFVASNAQDPRAVDAAIRRGLALARAGKMDEAALVLERALAAPGTVDESLRRSAETVLADAAMSRSDWAGAERGLRSLTSKNPSPDALLKLGIALQRQGRAAESVELFTRIIDESPSDGATLQARFERGQVLVEQGKLDEAKADFEAVLSVERESDTRRFSVHCLRHLASIASRQNRAEDAAALLAKVAESPEAGAAAADAMYERGAALLAAGQYQEADGALEQFMKASPAHPRAADAAAQRAIATSRLGEYEQALTMMEASEQGSVRAEILAALRYERGWALKSLNRAEEARAAYERLLSASLPPALEAHAALDLSQLLIAANQHVEAVPVLARALKSAERLSPEERSRLVPNALYLRGACELKLERAAEAAATLDDLLTRYPNTDLAANARLLSGQSLLRAGKPEAAARQLEASLAAKLTEESVASALLCLGEARAGAQHWKQSREAFERHLKQFPKSDVWFQSQFGIGWSLENEGRHAEAISAYREVVTRHDGPSAARAQFQIGECLFAQKQYDEAVRELLKVDILYAYPEWSAAALYEAGRCLGQLNKHTEARSQFTQVVERFKDTQWARLAAEQLAKTEAATSSTLPGRAAAEGP